MGIKIIILILFRHGSTMLKLDVDVENGGIKLDENFLVDFGADKDDILLAHEIRYTDSFQYFMKLF